MKRELWNLHDLHFRNWNDADYEAAHNAKDFHALAETAMTVLNRYPGKLGMVSGPISTGGFGSPEKNMAVFRSVVEYLSTDKHLNIFSQVPFEIPMHRLHSEWTLSGNTGYCMPILNDFYDVIFGSGKISDLYLIDGWQSSFGARHEVEFCKETDIEIHELGKDLALEALRMHGGDMKDLPEDMVHTQLTA